MVVKNVKILYILEVTMYKIWHITYGIKQQWQLDAIHIKKEYSCSLNVFYMLFFIRIEFYESIKQGKKRNGHFH